MRETKIIELYPKIEREFVLPADKARSLRARVMRLETIRQVIPEMIAAMLDDAEIASGEAWEEIAKIGGFESLADVRKQGFELSCLAAGVVQVRSGPAGVE